MDWRCMATLGHRESQGHTQRTPASGKLIESVNSLRELREGGEARATARGGSKTRSASRESFLLPDQIISFKEPITIEISHH